MVRGHAQFDVTEVTGAEGSDVAAGDAGPALAVLGSSVRGAQQGIVQATWQGGAQRVVCDRGRDFADGALSDFVVGVDGELDGGGP